MTYSEQIYCRMDHLFLYLYIYTKYFINLLVLITHATVKGILDLLLKLEYHISMVDNSIYTLYKSL